MAIHNTSNKPMVERECFDCGVKGHTIEDYRKISIAIKKELISLRLSGMSNRPRVMKKSNIVSQEGIQHVVQEEVTIPETETPGADANTYLPELGLLSLHKLYKLIRYTNVNVTI